MTTVLLYLRAIWLSAVPDGRRGGVPDVRALAEGS